MAARLEAPTDTRPTSGFDRDGLAQEGQLVGDDAVEEWSDLGIEVAAVVDVNRGLGHLRCRALGDPSRRHRVVSGDLDKGGTAHS